MNIEILYKINKDNTLSKEKIIIFNTLGITTKDKNNNYYSYTFNDINKNDKNIFSHIILAYHCLKSNLKIKIINPNGVIKYEV